jgi:hypothetical protein
MNDLVEIAIVTYEPDVIQCVELVNSIRQHGFIQKDIKINIIVNDTDRVFHQVTDLLYNVNNIKIHKVSDFDNIDVSNQPGWWTQQYFKLAVAKFIDSPWYVIIDSDQGLWGLPVVFEDWFLDNGQQVLARYSPVSFKKFVDQQQPWFIEFWKNAADHWKVDIHNNELLLSETPPVFMNTVAVKNLMSECDISLLILKQVCHEFALYWCYLIKKDLVKNLYIPLTKFSAAHKLRLGRPLPPLPYKGPL